MMAQTPQQLKFSKASAKVRAEGVKPFTKAFGKRMKQLLGGRGGKKKSVKRRTTKTKKSKPRKTKTTKSRTTTKKSVVARKGTSGMTRIKKFLLGIGIGAAVSTTAQLTRVREVESVGPIIDAAVGGGVEAQIGTAIPRLIRLVASRAGFNGGGNGNMALEGA